MDLKAVKARFVEHASSGDLTRPLFEWSTASFTQMHGKDHAIDIRVYTSRGFLRQTRARSKLLRKDPQQLYKALRNTRRGYRFEERMTTSGRDGIFDLDPTRFDNDMTQQLQKALDDPAAVTALRASYPFLCDGWQAVRVVAHPHSIRVRPVGLLTCVGDGERVSQRLVLLALGVVPVA